MDISGFTIALQQPVKGFTSVPASVSELRLQLALGGGGELRLSDNLTVALTVLVLAVNLVADVLMAILDPRLLEEKA